MSSPPDTIVAAGNNVAGSSPSSTTTTTSSSSSSSSSTSSVSSTTLLNNNNNHNQYHLHNYIDLREQKQEQISRLQQVGSHEQSPSNHTTITTVEANTTTKEQSSSTSGNVEDEEQQPTKKKKRQHIGYACDKCRERRVGCDRGKPICGQCKDRYTCQYSNHALRLDSVSLRQRLDELETQVGWMTCVLTNLEQDYRTNVPVVFASSKGEKKEMTTTTTTVTQQQQQQQGPSLVDWAVSAGWMVMEHGDEMKSIFTTIKKFEDLSEALRNTMQMMYYNDQGFLTGENLPMYRRPLESSNAVNDWVTTTTGGFATATGIVRKNSRSIAHDINTKHTFTLFESLNRYTKDSNTHNKHYTNDDRFLEADVMTRLIHQHHQCGFPVLVRPSRIEAQFQQKQLKPLVLSSVFSHSVPHTCIYHPHLTQIQDFRELGNKFYNHSHDLLEIDEPANLSNIHQRTLLITYDLDLGRVRRAFLHLGIAIRMCFMLNLHRPEGYVNCETAFNREQSKRIFWTVWFLDNMVTQLFHDQLSTIKLDQISIELPTPLPEFNRIEMDQTMFCISLIQIRKIAGSISEESRKVSQPRHLIDRFRIELARFYHNLPTHLQFNMLKNAILPYNISIWARRNYFCILLDYCQCWITLYQPLLPRGGEGEKVTGDEQEAILHSSQAAVAIIQLFQSWFQSSVQSNEGFDCFFRPYLYHFMSTKNVFSANVSQQYGRSPALVYLSRAYLMLLLQLYQTTPTRRSFDESQLEKDMLQFLNIHQIQPNEVPNQRIIDEALMDDPTADGGWSIFSVSVLAEDNNNKVKQQQQQQDDSQSRCSSNSSIMTDSTPPLPYAKGMDLDYF